VKIAIKVGFPQSWMATDTFLAITFVVAQIMSIRWLRREDSSGMIWASVGRNPVARLGYRVLVYSDSQPCLQGGATKHQPSWLAAKEEATAEFSATSVAGFEGCQ
jgi:hypothetical protein